MRYEVRVIFGDTDQMGVVYYANYLRFFEGARSALWRSLGRSYKDVEAQGIALPVVEAHVNYRKPARYEDLLEVEVEISEVRMASMRFTYVVWRGTDKIADGYTRHGVIGVDGRPRALPDSLRDMLEK
jgi:acyl-CoA thioester hydrolase